MSIDCELLKLAAKAAGLLVQGECTHLGVFTGLSIREDDCPSGYRWNPLTDDGDALRLLVQLRFSLRRDELDVGVFMRVREMNCGDLGMEVLRTDPYAATRRAIVRAAAELGKRLMGKQPDTRPICSADGCSLREPCGPFCRDRGNFDQHSRRKSQQQPGGRVVIGIKKDSDDPMPVPVYSGTYATGAKPESGGPADAAANFSSRWYAGMTQKHYEIAGVVLAREVLDAHIATRPLPAPATKKEKP